MHSKRTTVLCTTTSIYATYLGTWYIHTLSSKFLIKLHLISKNRKYYVNDVIFITTRDHFWPLSNKTRYVNKQLLAKFFYLVHCAVLIKFTQGI